MSTSERSWTRRLRWRFSGAWQWPTFAVATLVDALIIYRLPPPGVEVDLAFGVIVASFANLILVGLIAPWLARRLIARQRRDQATTGREGPPDEVIQDRTGTAVLCVGAVAVLAAGLGLQPVIVSETEATEENARAVQRYVETHGSEEVKRNLPNADTIRRGDGFFRTCIPLDDRTRAYCLHVDVAQGAPVVRKDSNPTPNTLLPGQREDR